MINVRSISVELTDLEYKVRQKTTHSFIKNQLDKPIIDLDKLFILNEVYQNTSMSRDQKQDYIVVIMLIDIALKTHDLINNENYEKQTDKQLTVLVGDYYSGMYYYLLSQIEDINMIKRLAANIKKINEEKMKLHYTDNKSEKEVYNSLLISETYLFTETAKLNGENDLIPIIENLLMLNRLKKEQTDKESVLYKYYQQKQLTKPDLNIEETIETEVYRLKIELDSHMKNLSSNYSNYIYKNTLNSIQTNISQVEEG